MFVGQVVLVWVAAALLPMTHKKGAAVYRTEGAIEAAFDDNDDGVLDGNESMMVDIPG